MPELPVVLVVGDDARVRGLVATALRHIGCAAVEAGGDGKPTGDGPGGRVDLLVVDECTSPAAGSSLVRRIRMAQPHVKVVRLTSRASSGTASCDGHIDVILDRPFALHDLCQVVESWLGGAVMQVAGGSTVVH
jgi:DNA-binding response OmpR family regulator